MRTLAGHIFGGKEQRLGKKQKPLKKEHKSEEEFRPLRSRMSGVEVLSTQPSCCMFPGSPYYLINLRIH